MKRITFLTLCLIFLYSVQAPAAGADISESFFPDEEFRKLVSDFDKDGDHYLSPAECNAVTEIDCNRNTDIRDVTGIEYFPELKNLSVWHCGLKQLDVSSNPKLVYLDCANSGISSLNISANPMLKELRANGNQFLTLIDLSHCPDLLKAVKNGIVSNNANKDFYMFQDDDTESFILTDRNVQIKIGDQTMPVSLLKNGYQDEEESISSETPDYSSEQEENIPSDTPDYSSEQEDSQADAENDPSSNDASSNDASSNDASSNTAANAPSNAAAQTPPAQKTEDTGIGGIASPAAEASYPIGSEILLDIRPTGSASLGNVSVSGTCQVWLGNTVKFSETISTSGTTETVTYSFTPDSAGTYVMAVNLSYTSRGIVAMQIGTSYHSRVFQVTDPNAASSPASQSDKNESGKQQTETPAKDYSEEQTKSGAEACKKHTFGKWKVTKKATYTSKGQKTRICSKCGFEEKTATAKLKVKNGTVLKTGSASYKVLAGLKTVAYKAPVKKTVKTVSVPAAVKLAGKTYKVAAIAANAFKGLEKLNTVTIGKNITTIGKNAFYGCKNLRKIVIKTGSLKTVGAGAFKGIHAKAVIRVPKKKVTAYTKLLKKKGIGKKVKVTK